MKTKEKDQHRGGDPQTSQVVADDVLEDEPDDADRAGRAMTIQPIR